MSVPITPFAPVTEQPHPTWLRKNDHCPLTPAQALANQMAASIFWRAACDLEEQETERNV